MARIFFAILICAFGFFSGANRAGAAELVFLKDSTTLLGAKGVEIDNQLYDVEFDDRSADELFKISHGIYNFLFTTMGEAEAASKALLDQVFIGQYDFAPEDTYGITDTKISFIMTPYLAKLLNATSSKFLIANRSAVNCDDENYQEDYTIEYSELLASSSTTMLDPDCLVYAVWTRHTEAPVPEPATALLFSVGALGVAGFGRRKKTSKV